MARCPSSWAIEKMIEMGFVARCPIAQPHGISFCESVHEALSPCPRLWETEL